MLVLLEKLLLLGSTQASGSASGFLVLFLAKTRIFGDDTMGD